MTGLRSWRVPLAALALACRPAAPPEAAPAPVLPAVTVSPAASEWPGTLAEALRAAQAADFAAADRALLAFSVRHAGTPQGIESDFWRAIVKADPANTAASTRERIALFDAYLAAGPDAPRHLEAMVFRRLLESVESATGALATLRSETETKRRSREDEIRKLSEDLDRTMAELDRIKKRLRP